MMKHALTLLTALLLPSVATHAAESFAALDASVYSGAQNGCLFGLSLASEDLGRTWSWLEPTTLNQHCQGYSGIASNGEIVLIVDVSGENVFRSLDAGGS